MPLNFLENGVNIQEKQQVYGRLLGEYPGADTRGYGGRLRVELIFT